MRSYRKLTPAQVVFVLFAILIFWRITSTERNNSAVGADSEIVTITRVLDGDTVDCSDGRRVRLLGIDAPELSHEGRAAERYADESTEWLRTRIADRQVRLEFGPERTDRYGRTLAWIYDSENRLVNRDLLAAGAAKLLADFGLPLELEPSLRAAEAEARIARRGLWAR